MNNAPWANPAKRFGSFPIGAFLVIVFLVCVGLSATTVYSYFTIQRLRIQYLQNLAHEVAVGIDARARGPGRRHNPDFWQGLIEDYFANPNSSMAYIALVDEFDGILAGKSNLGHADFISPPGFTALDGTNIFVFDLPLTAVNQGQFGAPQVARWRLQIGLYSATADFIQRQAIIQAFMTGAAIITLLALAYYFLQTLARFIGLENRERSERHLKALGSMSAALAHEIRNPLGAIKGLTQLVQEDLPKSHSTQSLMTSVVHEAERLESLVSDLLDFSRPRRPSMSEFNFAQLLADVKSMLESNLQGSDKTLEVVVTQPLTIYSDENGMRQVLLNTLLNAIDFTPDGGKIVLRARLEENSKTAITEIDDSGPGLIVGNPEELFEPFVTTKTRGTGLGLAVSRQIVNNLGGTIKLANLPGGGARCTIRIPARRGAL